MHRPGQPDSGGMTLTRARRRGWSDHSVGRPTALLVLLLLTTLLVGACRSPEAVQSSCGREQGHGDAHEAEDEAPSPLAAGRSPLIHCEGEEHEVAEVELPFETHDDSTASYVPLAALGSPLVHPEGEPHLVSEVRLGGSAGATSSSGAVALPGSVAGRPPRPAPSPSPSPAARPSPIPALIELSVVSGTVEAVQDRTLTISDGPGHMQVLVGPNTRLEKDGSGTTDDLRAGLAVSVINRQGGRPATVRLHSRGAAMAEPGVFPLSGPEQGSVMTTGTIVAVYPRVLSVSASGQVFQVPLPAVFEVFKPTPAGLADVGAGARIVAVGTSQAGGTLAATSIRLAEPEPIGRS